MTHATVAVVTQRPKKTSVEATSAVGPRGFQVMDRLTQIGAERKRACGQFSGLQAAFGAHVAAYAPEPCIDMSIEMCEDLCTDK